MTTCGGSIPATAVKAAPLAAITPTAYLAANASTIRWGYYSNTVAPAITVNSGCAAGRGIADDWQRF